MRNAESEEDRVDATGACEILGIRDRTLRRWVKDGYLPVPQRWGGRRKMSWTRAELVAFKRNPPPYPVTQRGGDD